MGKLKLTKNSIIQRKTELLFSKMDEEVVMMNIDKGEYYGLDEIGSRIWQILEKPVHFNDIIQTLTDEYDVEETTCRDDVAAFLKELHEKDLIVVNN
ncbi:MAG: lasso peptide biosynthesis PqqD family chaperone [Bacteroidales bacterium]